MADYLFNTHTSIVSKLQLSWGTPLQEIVKINTLKLGVSTKIRSHYGLDYKTPLDFMSEWEMNQPTESEFLDEIGLKKPDRSMLQ